MIHREDSGAIVAFTQPTHAWVAGQIARDWGNQLLGDFAPREEVCLGTELHDIGWLEWENKPTLNLQTCLPYNYRQMPRQIHLRIWSSAGRSALPYGRYAALLVSMHGTGLYEDIDYSLEQPEDVNAIRAYLVSEQKFQNDLITSLRNDPYYTNYATLENITRNRQLIVIWDLLSLAICRGLSTPYTLSPVPTVDGETELTLTPMASKEEKIYIEAWPFQRDTLIITFEGRRLTKTYSNQDEMRTALEQASWQTVTVQFTREAHA